MIEKMSLNDRKLLKKTKSDFKKSVKEGTYPGRTELIAEVITFPESKMKANWKLGMLKL